MANMMYNRMVCRKNILVFVITVFCCRCYGTYYQHQMNLFNDLLDIKRYDSRILPVMTPGTPLPIHVDIGFGDYIDIHEDTQTMTIDLWLTLYWTDDLLRWNTSDYGGISSIIVDVSQVWHIDIFINFVSNYIKIMDERAQISVAYDGTVRALVMTSISFRCVLNVAKFPFDYQTCKFYIIGQNAVATEAFFHRYSMNKKEIGAGQWNIKSYDANIIEKANLSMIIVSISVQRTPSYYIIYILLPIIATAELNPVVFLIGAESGEKISTAVTILLSYTVFLSIISDVLPKTSTSISAVSIYIVFSLIISGVYVLLCVFIVRCSSNMDRCNPCLWFGFKKSNSVSEEREHVGKILNKTPSQHAATLDIVFAVVSFSLISILSLSVIIFVLV